MPAAEAVRRGESKRKWCTSSNSKRVHLWQEKSSHPIGCASDGRSRLRLLLLTEGNVALQTCTEVISYRSGSHALE